MDNGKKLFVITVNEVWRLNDCFLNRPGRFHYHFEIKGPNADEIKEYFIDKGITDEEIINQVIMVSTSVDMSYDILRAIAFDLNQGYTIAETLEDMNICTKQDPLYNYKVTFIDGVSYTGRVSILSDSSKRSEFQFKTDNGKYIRVNFLIKDSQFSIEDGRQTFYLDIDKAKLTSSETDWGEESTSINGKIKSIVLTKSEEIYKKMNFLA